MNMNPKDFCPAISFSASLDEVGCLQTYLEGVSLQAKLQPAVSKRLRLAVEEAVANIINHSHATTIALQTMIADGRIIITIDDDGIPFNPTQDSPTDLSLSPDQRPPGGMGIILLQRMSDALSYRYYKGHNILTITKNI